jgi:hypothetical protein
MRVIKISKFLQEETRVEWLIDDLLPNVGWTLFYAPAKTGKSTFAAQMCLALQDGTPFLGRKTRKTSVMYVQADSIALEWKEMLRRIAPNGSDGFTAIDVPERVLGIPTEALWLKQAVQMYNPGYIVFDSLYKLTAWPINNDNGIQLATAQLLAIADDRPFMLIHHPPHESSRPAGHNSLGASASYIWALLRTMLKMEGGRLTKEEKILLKRDENGLWQVKPTLKDDVLGDNGKGGSSYTTYSVL